MGQTNICNLHFNTLSVEYINIYAKHRSTYQTWSLNMNMDEEINMTIIHIIIKI